MKHLKQYSNGAELRVFNSLQAMARSFQGSIFLAVQHITRNRVNHMSHSIKLATLGLLFCASPIFADGVSESTETSDNFRVSIIGGITLGGDKIVRMEYLDGSTNNIYAGRFGYFGGGLEYDINEDFMVQLNAQYHWDTATAINGDITFSRYEFEAIPYYRLNERFRAGLGFGLHTNVKLTGDLAEDSGFVDFRYDNATAIIGSVGYKLKNSDRWVEFRVVSVEYDINKVGNQAAFSTQATDGSHIGLSYHWLF